MIHQSTYASSDHEYDDEYPSLRQDDIIEPYIAGVDDNINDDNTYNNTENSNTNSHDDSYINTTDNTYVLQPPNDANTEYEDTKDANTEYENTK